jgi:spore coat polysaccharide biosynthesis protein SpsF
MLTATKIATVLSARMASTRLPGKATLPLGGVPMIQFIIERLRDTHYGGKIILATTQRADDDVLAHLGATLGIGIFRGADADVAGRYVAVAREFGLDWIVRVTGDCPFLDAQSLDHCLAQWQPESGTALWTTKGVFPVGIDCELISCAALSTEWPAMSEEEREHVTLRFYGAEAARLYGRKHFTLPASWGRDSHRYTVDTLEDYTRACDWVDRLGCRNFSVTDLLNQGSA